MDYSQYCELFTKIQYNKLIIMFIKLELYSCLSIFQYKGTLLTVRFLSHKKDYFYFLHLNAIVINCIVNKHGFQLTISCFKIYMRGLCI